MQQQEDEVEDEQEEEEEDEEESHPRDVDEEEEEEEESGIVLQYETGTRHAFSGAPLKGSREKPVESSLRPDLAPLEGWWF
jgi:hypothetical protein